MIKIKITASSVLLAGLLLGSQSARAHSDVVDTPGVDVVPYGAHSASLALSHSSTAANANIAVVLTESSGAPGHEAHAHDPATKFQIPKAMQLEHEELHTDLAVLTQAGGRTGEAARGVAEVLNNHFAKENEYALPPLSLLVPLSQGKFDCSMTDVLNLTDKLEAEMPTMRAEHKDIVAALGKLNDAGNAESKPGGVQFAEMLVAHAQQEEEITYPAALLIGLYVKSKSAQCRQ